MGIEKFVCAMKLFSYCFEWMTGLKINYHKSEVNVYGVSEEEQ